MRRRRFVLPLALACTISIGVGPVPANAEASATTPNPQLAVTLTTKATSAQPGVLYSGGSAYVPLTAPMRLIDTRQQHSALPGPLPTGKPAAWPFGTAATEYTAGVFNATVVQPTGNGFLSLYPYNPQDAGAVPSTSNLNYRTGQTVPGLAITCPGTQLDSAGAYELGIYLGGQGNAQLLLDWFGFYQNH